jgi:ribose 5-phosphate isomerase B
MKVFIGSDHRGFEYKSDISLWLESNGYDVVDKGANDIVLDDDYTLYALSVAHDVQKDPTFRGILFCGSGVGVSIMANRVRGIRCALGFDEAQVRHAVTNDHANILAIASEYLPIEKVKQLCEVFLTTEYNTDPRYLNRREALDRSLAV